MMTQNNRPATELEFAAKQINDLLTKRFKDRKLGFLTFVFDYGHDGHIGYLASVNRKDAFRMITEWLEVTIKGFSREDIIEILKRYETEL